MAYTGRLRPQRVPFSGFSYIKGCLFFWLSSSPWGAFFRCCLIHLIELSLFRKGHVLHFTEIQKRSSFPNHHWTATEPNERKFTPSITQQILHENKTFEVSNLRCGWSSQAISVTSVTLDDPGLERIRCMKSRQSFSRFTRPAGVWGSRAWHSRITLTALRAFRNNRKWLS